ncbi:MAG: hypothetical protein JNM90_08115, partial [Burkholderiales bacterium]|nr:hypothetical protein [Burkholderiales bacterium]
AKNFSVDHLVPIGRGGSSWPGNLAFVLKAVNQQKADQSKATFVAKLGKENGADWLAIRKAEWTRIDKERRAIDKRRREHVADRLMAIEESLSSAMLDRDVLIAFRLEVDRPILYIGDTIVQFPPGMLRRINRGGVVNMLKRICDSVLNVK